MIKDILNKVSDNGYGALSDSEFEELKKYPRYKDVFNKIADNGYGALSYSEFEELKSLSTPTPSTYQFQPGQREDLMANLHEVGYSGLDDTQKALYKQQYDASDYARAGHSFQEAIDLADKQANQNSGLSGFVHHVLPEMPRAGYEAARDVLAKGIVAPALSYLDALQTTEGGTNEKGKLISVPRWPNNPSYAERLGLSQKDLVKSAQKGEGIEGALADPATAAQLGIGFTTLGASIPAQTIIGGLGSGVSHWMNTENPTLSGTALSTGLGAGLGAAGTAIFGSPARRFAERELESGIIASDISKLEPEISRLSTEISTDAPIYKTMGIVGGDKPGTAAKEVYKSKIGMSPTEAKQSVLNPERAKEINDELATENIVADDNGDFSGVHKLNDELRSLRVSDPVAERHITDLKGEVASNINEIARLSAETVQLDGKIKLGTKLGISEKELAKLQSQKANLERQLAERQTRPLYPTADEMLKRSVTIHNPALSVMADKTGIVEKGWNAITGYPGKKIYSLVSGIGNVGSTVTDRFADKLGTKISEEVSKDPMTKGLIKRIEKKVR